MRAGRKRTNVPESDDFELIGYADFQVEAFRKTWVGYGDSIFDVWRLPLSRRRRRIAEKREADDAPMTHDFSR